MPGGFGGGGFMHGGGRGGRGGGHGGPGGNGKKRRLGHPVFRRDRSGSRQRFWSFIRENGCFGGAKPGDPHAPPEDAKEARDAKKNAEASEDTANAKEFSPAEMKPERSFFATLRAFARLLKGNNARIAVLLILAPIEVGLHGLLPWSSKHIIDNILTPQLGTDLLLRTCLDLILLGLMWNVLSMAQDYQVQSLIGTIVTGTRRKLMKHLQQMPLQRLQDLKVGGIISRLQADTDHVAGLLNQAFLSPYNALLMIILAIGSLLTINWQVTLICLGLSMLVLVSAYLFFNRMRPFQRMLREELGAISGHLAETFGGIQIVRAFAREHSESKAYSRETHLLWRKGLYASILNMVVHRSVRMVHLLIYASIWAVGGFYYLNGQMGLGDLVAFTMFIGWIFQPIFMIMGSFSQMQSSFACAERVFDLLEEPVGMPDRPDARAPQALCEEIRFEDVTFNYPDGTRALSDVNLTIPRGTVTALVGSSGAGKTTITNLVTRFYDPTDGRVTLDGTDLRDLQLSAYRRLIGLVLQEIFLFDGTIRENIAYGNLDASDEQIREAARVAHCAEFIERLENGYDTIVGERGTKLSTGQKQRLALARALLTDPQLLILDEATSNLDSESEALIQDALRHIFEDRTTLVIAHRLSTILDADNIVVVDKGRIVEQGKHEELLAARGRYHELYMKQMEKAERSRNVLDWSDGETEQAEARQT